jgi:hypothetical protein
VDVELQLVERRIFRRRWKLRWRRQLRKLVSSI